MSQNIRMTTKLRELLKKGAVVAPSVYDAFSARMAELAGFEAVHLTGYGFEVTQIGAPDLGLMSPSELSIGASHMTSAINIPLLADIDTGFGGVLNIHRTIREMEKVGVAGVHIEDQQLPKHCPLLSGRNVVSRQEGIAHIKAAVEARTDPDFVIVARSDADVISIDEVIERSNLYLEAGADMAMPMFMTIDGKPYGSLSPDEQMELHRRVAKGINGPVMATGNNPPDGYTVKDMADAGYSFIMFGGATLTAVANAMAELFDEIKRSGTPNAYLAQHQGPYTDSLNIMRAVGLDKYVEIEEKHITSN